MDRGRRISVQAYEAAKAAQLRKNLHSTLGNYLDIIEQLLTLAESSNSAKQRDQLLETADKMIENYKELDDQLEELVEAEGRS